MDKAQVMGIIRHLITSGAGVAATLGYVESSEVEGIVGAVLLLAGVAWSMAHKKGKAA